jgi:hypothetical protein
MRRLGLRHVTAASAIASAAAVASAIAAAAIHAATGRAGGRNATTVVATAANSDQYLAGISVDVIEHGSFSADTHGLDTHAAQLASNNAQLASSCNKHNTQGNTGRGIRRTDTTATDRSYEQGSQW